VDRIQNRVDQVKMQRLHAELEASLEALFRDSPVLCGFTLDSEFFLADVTCYCTLEGASMERLCDHISQMLDRLVSAQPEALELLRGRSFARNLH
jgi:hypothetical protein